MNLINYIVKNYLEEESGQIIMTTHSPNITSKVDIEKIIMCKNNGVYSLKSSETKLEKGDYKFLSRFLDVTKSNLFFAKNIIFSIYITNIKVKFYTKKKWRKFYVK